MSNQEILPPEKKRGPHRFVAGEPKPKGAGRAKGTPNKISGDIKQMVLDALEMMGGAEYLMLQAAINPGPFLALVGKTMPLQVTGAGGGPLEIATVAVVIVDPQKKT